ncbi:hypothetical protein VCE7224_01472 [Vibrio celticus]|uniref:Uncharacterized protein n=1 Tax=Vibrio celticus TaxID=446372 RepID=A0A1C3JC90_9VIBR|nr:hypothetical protein VCE7224_01472 [Vibrio celticus]
MSSPIQIYLLLGFFAIVGLTLITSRLLLKKAAKQ